MANLDSFADRTSHLVDQETRIGDASREERDARYTPLANTTTLEVDNDNPTEAETLIDVLLQSVIIHSDRPMENLPTLSPPELKVIGRCVTLKGETHTGTETIQLYYEGLVGTINKDTVMLIHVNRYTEEDWQVRSIAHVNRCDEKDEKTAGTQGRGTAGVAEDPPNILEDAPADPTSPVPENGMNRAEDTARVRNHLQNHTGSMGPIPFMTFARNRISNVEFGKDPRSSFYSLFRDPSKEHFDMQCLRMFCRRYIVHTAQGSNPKMIPLRSFVTTRCNCPDLDNDLLVRVTREEIAHLVKVERGFKRSQISKENNRRHILRTYQAPCGPFAATGILYLTGLPKQTFILATLMVFTAFVTTIYSTIFFSRCPKPILYPYSNQFLGYIMASVLANLVAGTLCAVHSLSMTITIRRHLPIAIARVLFVTVAMACSLMCMIVVGDAAKYSRVRRYVQEKVDDPMACHFTRSQHCMGFDQPCQDADGFLITDRFCFCVWDKAYTKSCKDVIMGVIERGMIPVVCLSLVSSVLLCFDYYFQYRLIHLSRLLQQGMRST